MEEFDDLLQEPDESGVLLMQRKGWSSLDPTIFEWGAVLMVLNVSFNELTEVPAEIGNLILLRDFDCSHNAITALPPTLSRCAELKILSCSSNKLTTLPTSLKQCKRLELLIAEDNKLETLPRTLGDLEVLQRLKLARNDLKSLPFELSKCPRIEEIDVTENPHLDMVPEELRHNTAMILWVCSNNRDHQTDLDDMATANEELEMLAKTYDDQKIAMRAEIVDLRARNGKLLAEQPRHYMKIKKAVSSVCAVM